MRILLLALASVLLFTGTALADDFDNWGTDYYDQVIDSDYGGCNDCNRGCDSCGHAKCDSCSDCRGMKAAHSSCGKCGAMSMAHSDCGKCGAKSSCDKCGVKSDCGKCGAKSVAHSGCDKCGSKSVAHSGCDKCGSAKSECRSCKARSGSRCG